MKYNIYVSLSADPKSSAEDRNLVKHFEARQVNFYGVPVGFVSVYEHNPGLISVCLEAYPSAITHGNDSIDIWSDYCPDYDILWKNDKIEVAQ